MLLVYEPSFEGLMTALARVMEYPSSEWQFAARTGDKARHGSLFGVEHIPPDADAASSLVTRIRNAGGQEATRHLLHAFLSERPGLEPAFVDYIRLTLAERRSVDRWHAHPAVRSLHKAADATCREGHRFMGLLRFSKLADGSYYAPFEPDHNVILIVARHFMSRFGSRRWVIHDRRRQLAVLWNRQRLQPIEPPDANLAQDESLLADDEQRYRDCWRLFSRKLALESRRNPKLQQAFMPKKYWRYLTELQPETRTHALGS